MKHAYTIQFGSGSRIKKLRCASAWVAYEQQSRLARKGQKVLISDHAGEPVTVGKLEAAARAEGGGAVTGTEEARGPPISARNLLMGS